MGGAALGAPRKPAKEGDAGGSGPTGKEPDAGWRRAPPQPEGLSAKGSHAASAGLNGVPAPPCAHFLAWNPFAINAASADYLDALLEPTRKPLN